MLAPIWRYLPKSITVLIDAPDWRRRVRQLTIATLDTEITNLSQAAARYPAAVNLNASQRTQATLTWLIRYQIFEEMARQVGITVSTAQAERFAHHVLQLSSSEEIRSYLTARLHEVSSTLEVFDTT